MRGKKVTRREVVSRSAVAAAALGGTAVTARDEDRRDSNRLSGRVALVTGAARGIGRAIAIAYAREGAHVAALDICARVDGTRDYPASAPADLEETVRLVRSRGRKGIALRADVRDLKTMREAADRAARELGGLDVVVANAGICIWTSFEGAQDSPEDYYRVVDVNVNGVWNSCWAALPHLKHSKAGRIITLSSIGGRMGVTGNGAYAATKWAVIGATKSLALELGKYGITVNAIAPTAVNTPMYRSKGQLASTGLKSFLEQDTVMKGFHGLPTGALDPGDIASSAVFLASDEAKFVSGLVLDVAAGGNGRYSG